MSSKVAIIDYGMGNLFSVKQACEHAGLSAAITSDGRAILDSRAAILPGVGAFGDAIKNIRALGLADTIKRFIDSGRPFMGICLGMQLLFDASDEFGRHEGLGILGGTVVRFPAGDSKRKTMKVPHVGWARVRKTPLGIGSSWEDTPLKGLRDNDFMYFVHSYYCRPAKSDAVLSVSRYGDVEYCSGILDKNILAFQFHPEKSGENGISIYRNWLPAQDRKENRWPQ